MTDQPVRIRLEIDKQAQQAVNAAIDATAARFVSLSDKLGKASVQAQQAGAGFKKAFGVVTEEVETASKAISKIQEGSASFYRGLSGLTGGALGEIAQTSRQIEEVTRGFQKMTSQGIGPLLKELGPTVLAAGALSIGIAGVTAIINAFNQDIEEQKKQLREEMALRQELRDLSRVATTEEAQKKRDAAQQNVEDIKAEIEYYKKRRIELLAGGFNLETAQRQAANTALLKEQEDALIVAEEKLRAYNDALDRNAFRENDRAAMLKKMNETLTGSIQSIGDFAKSSQRATDAFKELQKAEDDAFDKVQQRNKDLATAQGKYETDVQNIQESSLQKRADIEQKFADTQVNIAQDALQKAQDRLAKLEQARADYAASFARGEQEATQKAALDRLDIEIKAQREERDALRDHLRTLDNIRASAKLREQNDLLNRNFLGVLQSRMQMTGDIDEENRKFVQGQQDRAQATRDQLTDQQRAQAQERAARLKAYQQQLADAQAAYQRETVQASKDRALAMARAQMDRNKALAEEERGRVQSLAALRKRHVQELQDIYDFGVRKLKLERDLLQASLNMIAQANIGARGVRTPRGPTVTEFAGGGDIAAGQWGLVQEGNQREAFNGIPFPTSGAGMFYPLQGGQISSTTNNNQTHAPVNITIPGAQNPQEIARVVVDVVRRVMAH